MVLALLASLALTARLDSPVTDRAEELGKLALKQGHEPRAAATLIRLRALLDEVDDLNLLVEPFTQLLHRRSTDHHVRTLALLFLADVERARGRTVRAKDLTAELGFVQDWHLVGGFDNEGKGGCNTDFGPESAPDLHATYPLAGRDVGWRRPAAKSASGYVDLSVSLRPNTEAVGYALTFLRSDAETRATLGVGTSGAFRLFVNGVKVAASDRYNQPRVDQHLVEVRLRKGTNRLLLKVCQSTGPFGFFLRATSSRAPVPVQVLDSVPPLERGGPPAPVLLPTLTEALERQLKVAPNDGALRGDYATVLAWARTYSELEKSPEREAERAVLQRPDLPELAVSAAELQDDGNDRRRLLEGALKLAPTHPWARLRLAQHELVRDHPDVALRLATALLQDFPRFSEAWGVKVRALDALGDKVASFRAAEAAFATLPVVPSVARQAVAAARRADRVAEAVERARMLLALRFDDTDTRTGLAALLADLGQVDAAAEQYRKVLAIEESGALFAQAHALAPDDPDVWERTGRALLHAHQHEPALAALQRALVLRPQNPALKEMLRTLRGESDAASTTEALAMSALLDEAKALAPSSDDAVVLAEVTHVRVQTSGLSSRFRQLVVKVQNQRGVEAWRTLPITWSPDRQEVRVLKARLTRPDGSVIDSFAEQDRNINEPWTGMYYDARAKVLTFSALAPGDVLEVQWKVDDTSVENLLSDYWGDVELLQSGAPKRHLRYVVDMPTGRRLYWNQQSLASWVQTQVVPASERTAYRFEASNVPKLVPEPQMPGWAEVSPLLHLSTYASWEAVGRYYFGLVRDQLLPNEELKRTVEATLKGVNRSDVSKVVAALYGFVVTNTRYVALEFGIHGYKPYRVDRVLARRFGDCKDKASLLHAMLKVAGVDSRLVLLRMRHLGTLPSEVASLAAFNHAIVYVPKLDLYLDGTADFHGSRELPSADRVANVLIVEPDGSSRFMTTPEAQPADNVTSLALELTLKTDGSAQGKGVLLNVGQDAPGVRRAFESVATRTSTLEQQFSQSFPGLEASEVTLSDPRALEQPVSLSFAMKLPRFAEAAPTALRFFPFGASRAFTQALAPLSERAHDVVLPGVWTNRLKFTYTLPVGWAVAQVPAETVLESPFGRLSITVRTEGAKLVVEGAMVVARARVTAQDYAAFRAWLLQVDQAFSRKLVVQRGEQTAAVR
jgi:tetratricopeptide (TPR) repeat protein